MSQKCLNAFFGLFTEQYGPKMCSAYFISISVSVELCLPKAGKPSQPSIIYIFFGQFLHVVIADKPFSTPKWRGSWGSLDKNVTLFETLKSLLTSHRVCTFSTGFIVYYDPALKGVSAD